MPTIERVGLRWFKKLCYNSQCYGINLW